MKFGLITQWFDPEPGPAALPGELARELVRRGHDVQVVTGFPNYPDGEIYEGYSLQRRTDEVVEGVKVRRVALYPSHDASAGRRIANYASFGASAAVSGIDCLLDRDVVWVSNSPPTVALPMLRLKRAGIPLVLHVMDLWPENILASRLSSSGLGSRAMAACVHSWNRLLYTAADRVLTISPGVVDLLAERGVPRTKMAYAPLWAQEEAAGPGAGDRVRASMGVDPETVVVLYAGALGATQDLGVLVDALALQPSETAGRLECWILGSGVAEAELRSAVDRLPVTAPRVRMLGRRPKSEMPGWLSASDIAFVGLRPDDHARYSMPSKVQATLSAGKPILASVPGDVDEFVHAEGVGLSSGGLGSEALAAEVARAAELGRSGLREMGDRGSRFFASEWTLEHGVDRIEASFQEVGADTWHAASVRDAPVVRRAAASDVPHVVQVHMRSFPGFFLTFLGPAFLGEFYRGLCEDPGAVLLVATSGGAVVGFAGGVVDEAGFFSHLVRAKKWAFAKASLGAMLRRPSVVPRLVRARRRGSEPTDAAVSATLLSIGVDPESQARGVGSGLIAAFADEMAALGEAVFSLTTDALDNDATIGFYRARGFEQVREFTTPEGRQMLEFVSVRSD